MKTTMLAALLLSAATGIASAGGQEGSIGAGVEYQLAGLSQVGNLGGPSINYDAGKFHVGGYLSLFDGDGADNTSIGLGGRFFYHVHSTAMSDFGVGSNIGFVNFDNPLPLDQDNSDTALFIEPGFQIRLFVASNVALSFNAGIVIGALDAPGGFALTGNVTGGAGVHYYFF
ncbi:MAG: hypothetical protein SFX73_37730 [Kofleriaceae bacterium]|nr:hypothetical protein [Kofleriaceae bacterium]